MQLIAISPSIGRGGLSWVIVRAAIVSFVVVTVIVASASPAALADCDKVAAAQCQATAANCRAHCDRFFHREETDRACHQECNANYDACRTGAECQQ
jgi:hypothetical protein